MADVAEKEAKGRGSAATRTVVRLQLYANPGIPAERLLLDVWEASAKARGKSQEIFRRAITLGLRQMCESGELEDAIVDEVGEDRILGRPRRRRSHAAPPVFVLPPGTDPRFASMQHGGYGEPPIFEAPPAARPPPTSRHLPPPRHEPNPEPEAVGQSGGLGDLM